MKRVNENGFLGINTDKTLKILKTPRSIAINAAKEVLDTHSLLLTGFILCKHLYRAITTKILHPHFILQKGSNVNNAKYAMVIAPVHFSLKKY